MQTFRTLALLAVFAAAGCSQAPTGPQFTQEDIDTITQQMQALTTAFNAKDPDAVAGLFSANAAVMPPNQSTSRSRDSVKQYYVARFAEGATNLEIEPRDISGVGALAYATGDFRLNVVKDGQEPQRDRGKFVWIFRETNDRWFIEYVVFNSDFAPRTAA